MIEPNFTDDVIDDLKQFITATVSQATADLATEEALAALRLDMDTRFNDVDQRFNEVDQRFKEVDKRFDDVDQKLITVADAHAEWLTDHENRLQIVEKQAA